jgi:molecular chaperone DnaJ
VTVSVAVPQRLVDTALTALQDYAEATKAFDPRADLARRHRRCGP